MSNSVSNNSAGGNVSPARSRRALLVDAGSATRLQAQLAMGGYETHAATVHFAARAIEEFAPHVVLIELRGGAQGEGNQQCLALARKLRAEPATYALPLVLVFEEDARDLRNAALGVGADDYFSVRTPAVELLARLDSLFWRTEAGRRAASVAGDQRLEIDNFILMLDAVRAGVRAGESGTLALVYAMPASEGATLDKGARDRTLAEAHGFLKLNLRRLDEVTFYGPTTLLVYLPRTDARRAQAALSALREQFRAERAGYEIAIGLASFPADGEDVESLIERAEAAALRAREISRRERVAAYQAKEQEREAPVEPRHEAAENPLQLPEMAAQPSQTAASHSEALTYRRAEPTRGAETIASRDESERHQRLPSQPFTASPPTSPTISSPTVSAPSTPPPAQPSSSLNSTARGLPAPVADRTGAPLNGAEAVKAAAEAGARELERRASGAIMPRRLLLTVSDAARMAQINALIRSAGYEARAAFDGQQALDLLRIERPDLMLLDYQLQGIDGVETLRRLRKQSGGRLKLPVVLLIPPDNELARREALELGARDVLTMPYEPAELLTSVRLAGNAE